MNILTLKEGVVPLFSFDTPARVCSKTGQSRGMRNISWLNEWVGFEVYEFHLLFWYRMDIFWVYLKGRRAKWLLRLQAVKSDFPLLKSRSFISCDLGQIPNSYSVIQLYLNFLICKLRLMIVLSWADVWNQQGNPSRPFTVLSDACSEHPAAIPAGKLCSNSAAYLRTCILHRVIELTGSPTQHPKWDHTWHGGN